MAVKAEIELKFSPREQQTQILEFVQNEIESGKKFIMIDAPTGVGKSYAAIMISDGIETSFLRSLR